MTTLITPSTELDAVNRMLGSIGQSPVSTLDVSGLPDVARAARFLREVLLDVQAQGWSWNTDKNYELQPNTGDRIVVPTGVLEVDPTDKTVNIVVRRDPSTGEMSLYDADGLTFAFTEAVTANIVWAFPFEDIPQAARSYISIAAARKFQAQTVSSTGLDGYNQEDEDRAWRRLNRIERRSRDTNSFRVNPEASRMLRRRF